MMIPLVLEVVCEISAMFSIEQQNFYLFVQLVSCVSWIFMVKTCGDYGELPIFGDGHRITILGRPMIFLGARARGRWIRELPSGGFSSAFLWHEIYPLVMSK